MAKVPFGLHDFLNAQPVLVPLLEEAEALGLEIVLDTPSSLADRLAAGELDAAMIPSVEYLHHADTYRLVPGLCIASRGPVGTVLLVSRKPLEEIRTLALDRRSRTSAALLKILFRDDFHPEISFQTVAPDLKTMLKEHDAALVIGDQAFQVPALNEQVSVYDLSERWLERTGLTFVHAVVAVRAGVYIPKDTVSAFREIAGKGLARLDSIVESETAKSGLSPELCRDYLENKIIYGLGDDELVGLKTFQELCLQNNLLATRHAFHFLKSGGVQGPMG